MTASNHEDRIRVICHLPVNNRNQEKALLAFINYIKQLKNLPGADVRGFTYSSYTFPTFAGYWYGSVGGKMGWIEDRIAIFYLDYRTAKRPPSEIAEQVKENVVRIYQEHAGPEEDVWVVAHPIIRHI